MSLLSSEVAIWRTQVFFRVDHVSPIRGLGRNFFARSQSRPNFFQPGLILARFNEIWAQYFDQGQLMSTLFKDMARPMITPSQFVGSVTTLHVGGLFSHKINMRRESLSSIVLMCHLLPQLILRLNQVCMAHPMWILHTTLVQLVQYNILHSRDQTSHMMSNKYYYICTT